MADLSVDTDVKDGLLHLKFQSEGKGLSILLSAEQTHTLVAHLLEAMKGLEKPTLGETMAPALVWGLAPKIQIGADDHGDLLLAFVPEDLNASFRFSIDDQNAAALQEGIGRFLAMPRSERAARRTSH